MAEAILLKSGGGGITSDDVTAKKEHILSGYSTVTVESDDEIVEGAMPDNTGWEQSNLLAGKSVLVPKGYHDGTKSVATASLASQTGVDSGKTAVGTSQMLSGYQGWVNGTKVTGTITSLAGGTYNASSAKQTISCKGKYMTSDIVINSPNVQSILSFNFASRDYEYANFKWKNPAKGAYQGIVVRGKKGGYPENINDGNLIYNGYGTNKAANGTSYSASQKCGEGTWYFRAYSYYLLDGKPIYHSTNYSTSATFTCYDCDHCNECDCNKEIYCDDRVCDQCSSNCDAHGPGQCTDCDQCSSNYVSGCKECSSHCDQCSDCGDYPQSCIGNS